MPWLSWRKNQIFKAQSMLKLFSIMKGRVVRGGPNFWAPPLQIGLIRPWLAFFLILLAQPPPPRDTLTTLGIV